eukprot:gene14098-4136_t
MEENCLATYTCISGCSEMKRYTNLQAQNPATSGPDGPRLRPRIWLLQGRIC